MTFSSQKLPFWSFIAKCGSQLGQLTDLLRETASGLIIMADIAKSSTRTVHTPQRSLLRPKTMRTLPYHGCAQGKTSQAKELVNRFRQRRRGLHPEANLEATLWLCQTIPEVSARSDNRLDSQRCNVCMFPQLQSQGCLRHPPSVSRRARQTLGNPVPNRTLCWRCGRPQRRSAPSAMNDIWKKGSPLRDRCSPRQNWRAP